MIAHATMENLTTMYSITSTVAFFLLLASSAIAAYVIWKSRVEKTGSVQQAYRLATEMAAEGFYAARPVTAGSGAVVDWTFTDCNETGAAYFGLQRHELIGKNFSFFHSIASLDTILEICARAAAYGYYEDEYEEPPGSPLNIQWVRRQLVTSGNGLAISLKDISGAKEYTIAMARLANEDPITTLPNRKWLTEFLPAVLANAKSKVGLLFIDLDDFKNVNDALGHSIGDLLLRAAAMRLKSVLGSHDKVVRLGGDEFAIVLTELKTGGEAKIVAELVNEILSFPLELVKGKKSISASVGVSLFPDDADDMDTLLKSAEIAMYSAKNAGKAHYRFYNPTLYKSLKDRLILEQELSEAIERDQFVLYYEPRMQIESGKLCGMEALVRWHHPERGLVPPLEFIPLAESTGLILELGELIIEKAFQQIALWEKMNLPVLPVSINISAHQFNAGNLSQVFFNAFDQYKISPHLIEIELTESAMLGDQTSILKELSAIRSLGIKLLIDDFGTGYSSLSQLQRLKMDILKVDRAFLHNLEKSREGEIFVKAIISMAHALGMGVIAEGVETKAQLEILRSLCCDQIQGHYLSKPMPGERMSELLAHSDLPMAIYLHPIQQTA
jgi:diguanylate cyclase (GGDEF)-like protein